MYNSTLRSAWGRMLLATMGCVVMAIGTNLFTTPLDLYTTGLMGYSQLIRSMLKEDFGFVLSGIDLAGVLYYIISVPIFFITYKSLGRSFLMRAIVFSIVFSLATALIPVPSSPLVDDKLTSVIIGGVCVGVGDGIVMTCGCTVGGFDMLGMYISKKNGLSVGRFTIMINILMFVICLFRYDFEVVLYSVIAMVFATLTLDRVHQQSINVQALIFTKYRDNTIPQRIMQELGRGVTRWDGYGAYTNEPTAVLCTCINRYELEQLERTVKAVDPNAFMTTTSNVHINGNFTHKV